LASQPSQAEPGAASVLSEHDVLKFEKEVLGFYFSGHPLLGVQGKLKCAATHEIAKLSSEITTPVRVAGLITQVKRMVTKSKGEQWARGVLEDLTGEISLLVFPRAYASGLSQLLRAGAIVSASGRLSSRGEGPESAIELIVDEIQPLDMAVIRFGRRLRLSCDAAAFESERLERLRKALEQYPGSTPVTLEHEVVGGTAILEADQRVRLDQNLLESIEQILGKNSWRIESASS